MHYRATRKSLPVIARELKVDAILEFHSDSIPVRPESGAEIRVYSGSSGSLRSGTRNYVPVTMVEINLERGAAAEQEVPVSYNGFVFVIGGPVRIGETTLNTGQVGWLDHPTDKDASVVRVVAGES